MSALAALLNQQTQDKTCAAYTAQMLWHLNHAVYKSKGAEFKYPSWFDLSKPSTADDRSGEEIVEDVKKMLRKRREKRERRKKHGSI